MESTQTKQTSFKSSVVTYLIYLGVFLAIMAIIGLFIYPSFRHWRMESQLEPITINYLRDGGSERQWYGDDYDYYANVGFRGQNYRVNVSESVYTGNSTPVFYYDASRDEVFEAGTGHTKVMIYCLLFVVVLVVVFIWPLFKSKKKLTPNPDAQPSDNGDSFYRMPDNEV